MDWASWLDDTIHRDTKHLYDEDARAAEHARAMQREQMSAHMVARESPAVTSSAVSLLLGIAGGMTLTAWATRTKR